MVAKGATGTYQALAGRGPCSAASGRSPGVIVNAAPPARHGAWDALATRSVIRWPACPKSRSPASERRSLLA